MTTETIRAAVPTDIDAIAGFNAAMARETEQRTLDMATLRAGVATVFAEPQHGFYRVAEWDGQVVACLLVTYEWSDWRNGRWWWLQSVYVTPAARGHGLFGRMYRAVRAEARACPGVCGLRLYVEHDNARAQAVYAALGMAPEPYRILHEAF
ncbi:MAG: GNAT family N-acetyltransferase [Xanthomonadales bacterium]|nr:GNAT family N-acetyltransferase [Xanthomonadales bacterium]